MFPLDHYGEFSRSKTSIPDVDYFRTDFFVRAKRALEAARAQDISITNNRIAFTGGAFRLVWNWNILVQIGYGYVELREDDSSFVLSYYASFRQLFVLVSAGLFLVFGIALFSDSGDELSIAGKLALLVFVWLFLFGGNLVVAMIRFPSFVESMLWGGDRI
jgi:hypothetical protein